MLGEMILGGVTDMLGSAFNNYMAAEREHNARVENYELNEKAASNADARTRALYRDLQSPKALLQQLQDANLSPSMMFSGGMAGASPAHGAEGGGAAGISPTTYGINPIEAANLALMQAQTEKTKAETQNISKDTDIKRIEEGIKQLEAGQYRNTWEILNSTWTYEGKQSSIFEIARNCLTYEQFMNKLRGSETDQVIKDALTTETGQQTARGIFIAASQFHRDIMVLSNESVNAQFQASITEELNNANFAELNAKKAVEELKKSIQTNELDERQKKAWNNLLNRLESTNPTIHDIVIVLGMIINNALTNYKK